MLAGASSRVVESWGFGRVVDSTGAKSTFHNGGDVPAPKRVRALTGAAYENQQPNFYARRRPKYHTTPLSNVMNVKALGAQGDGATDDTAVLNAILAAAANTSSIVHFPHGVYRVTDTLHVPIGSRIVGQAWSQIMGAGDRFASETAPRAVVRVANPGEVGVVEIQDMLFTVSGSTAGAIVLQWNAQESTQGSTGMWDTHVRVGGAVGSKLQASDCPKQLVGELRSQCKAAFMMVYLTPGSTAYLENVWAWTADHDLDTRDRKQVNVYTGRGMLIESRLAYLWGTSVEHATLYQYQISNARNIFLSTIQAETPYFQPMQGTVQPYPPGRFPGDPTFDYCEPGDGRCEMAWGARIVDSETVYMLSAGIYSWFNNYGQSCVDSDDCQLRAVEVEQSSDVWLFNLCTKAIVELISPHGGQPTLAAENRNGLLSPVLAWLRGARDTTGPREFPGFHVYVPDEVEFLPAADDICRAALSSLVNCHEDVQGFQRMGYRGSLGNNTLTNLVCQQSCGDSLASWVSNVQRACGPDATGNGPPVLHGARMYAGWNETCLRDKGTGQNCNDVIDRFAGEWYTTTRDGERCEDIALAHTTSSASLFMANQVRIISCAADQVIPAGTRLCIPPSCGKTYTLQKDDTCESIERDEALKLPHGAVAQYNPWVGFECAQMQNVNVSYGAVICLGPPYGGDNEPGAPDGWDTTRPPVKDGYSSVIVPIPEYATVAEGTTPHCGRWHEAGADDTCVALCMANAIDALLFVAVNPSLGTDLEACTSKLREGLTYCVSPYRDWRWYDDDDDDK